MPAGPIPAGGPKQTQPRSNSTPARDSPGQGLSSPVSMFARAEFDQDAGAAFALEHAALFRALGKLPYRLQHRLLVGATWLETWLRYPLRTLGMQDGIEHTFRLIDPDGRRLGLTEGVRKGFRDNLLYHQISDLGVLLLNLEDRRFRREALRFENADVLLRERERGPGAIVAGFRIGAYPAVPWALATIGQPVTMIVGGPPLVRMGRGLGRAFVPRYDERVRFVSARDPRALAQCREGLNAGGLACTLVELSPIEFAKTMPVDFLDWRVEVPYGIPYLSAVTGRTVVPAMLTRHKGPRFVMRFLEPIPAPARDREAIRESTQQLYTSLEREVRRYPAQWIGWTLLGSHMGIDLGQPAKGTAPAFS
jgi:hypothetical protein